MARRGPKDVNELAFDMMQQFTGEAELPAESDPVKQDAGRQGGLARARNMSASERSEAARQAVTARWEKDKSIDTT